MTILKILQTHPAYFLLPYHVPSKLAYTLRTDLFAQRSVKAPFKLILIQITNPLSHLWLDHVMFTESLALLSFVKRIKKESKKKTHIMCMSNEILKNHLFALILH